LELTGNLDGHPCLSTPGEASKTVGRVSGRTVRGVPGGTEMDYLMLGLLFVGWILLQHVLLPKLGVPT